MHKKLGVQRLEALAARERAEQLRPDEVERLILPEDPTAPSHTRKSSHWKVRKKFNCGVNCWE